MMQILMGFWSGNWVYSVLHLTVDRRTTPGSIICGSTLAKLEFLVRGSCAGSRGLGGNQFGEFEIVNGHDRRAARLSFSQYNFFVRFRMLRYNRTREHIGINVSIDVER